MDFTFGLFDSKKWTGGKALLGCLAALAGAPLAAGAADLVPIAVDDITFFVPAAPKINCLPSNDCVSWLTMNSTVVTKTEFSDDSEFNYSDETNKTRTLTDLYFYSETSKPLQLECFTPSGAWAAVASSSPASSLSAINSFDSSGAPQNLNTGAAQYPVYQHKWSGALLENMTNCATTTEDFYSPVTDKFTYVHTAKIIRLRAINDKGNAAVVMPYSQNECRLNDYAPNLWQRTINCAGGARPPEFALQVQETLTRLPNYTTLYAHTNPNPFTNSYGWYCSLKIKLDGVEKGTFGDVNGGTSMRHFLGNVKYGQHTIGFTVVQCRTRSCSGCIDGNVNKAGISRNSTEPTKQWNINPNYAPEQSFTWTLNRPSTP